jgi:hypothetical protein
LNASSERMHFCRLSIPPVVWFVIDLTSRRVHVAGLVRYPHDAWICSRSTRISSRRTSMTSSWRELIQPAIHSTKNRMACVRIAVPW